MAKKTGFIRIYTYFIVWSVVFFV